MKISKQYQGLLNVFRSPVQNTAPKPSAEEVEQLDSPKAIPKASGFETRLEQTKNFFHKMVGMVIFDARSLAREAPDQVRQYAESQGLDLEEVLHTAQMNLAVERKHFNAPYPKSNEMNAQLAYLEVTKAGTREGVLINNLLSSVSVDVVT